MAVVTRRTLVLGGMAGLALAGCGDAGSSHKNPAHVHPTDGNPVLDSLIQGSFVSRLRGGTETGWGIAYPPGHVPAALPVLVVLHGRGQRYYDAWRTLHLDSALAQVVARGTRPFAIAAVDGGDHDYWHPRHDSNPAGMVVHEFLPLLAEHGLRVGRIALLGWSMGGYGALYLAGMLGANRCAAAVAESPAIWHHSWQSVEGAFDDATDFDRHSIFGHLARLAGIPLHIDCGAQDSFAPITRDLRAALHPTPAGGIQPGGHDAAYWRARAPAQLAFVGRHLR